MFKKMLNFERENAKKWSSKAIISFLLTWIFTSLITGLIIYNKINIEKMSTEQLIMEKSLKINEVISKLLYKTQVLAVLVIQTDGKIENFERVAATIVDEPAILNVIIAPSGVVSHVYPVQGNEKVIGFNLLGDGTGNKEAMMAKETGQLVFGGPFHLVQGGQALVGRLPIHLKQPDGSKKFWGLVSVTLKYPQVLDGAGLDMLETQGLAYEIWRINPDNQEKQSIASSSLSNKHEKFMEKHIPILNADWYFRVSSVQKWYEYPETWVGSFIGLCISLLVAFVTQSNYKLKQMKYELEEMVYIDSLTKLFNRNGLFYKLKKLIDQQIEFQLHYIDLNHFKKINDTYGHNIGDYVLTEFSEKISNHMDSNYIFARISGDEFVLVHKGVPFSEKNQHLFWEKISEEFVEPIFNRSEEGIILTFSKGMAKFPEDGETIDELISCADQKMYLQKHDRNSVQ